MGSGAGGEEWSWWGVELVGRKDTFVLDVEDDATRIQIMDK